MLVRSDLMMAYWGLSLQAIMNWVEVRTFNATETLWSVPCKALKTACIIRGMGGIKCSSLAGASKHNSAASSSCKWAIYAARVLDQLAGQAVPTLAVRRG